MNLLEAEQGLTITRALAQVAESYIELTIADPSNVIEKPEIIAAEFVTDSVSAAMTRAANESFIAAPLQHESLQHEHESDTAVTGTDRDAVTEFIANETDLRPVDASEETAPDEEPEPESETVVTEKEGLGKNVMMALRRSRLGMFASAAVATAGGLLALHAENAKADTHKIDVGDAIEVSNGIHYLDNPASFSEVIYPTASSTAPEEPTDIETLKEDCINNALKLPKIKKAYVVHPGRKPYEKNSSELGPVETTFVSAEYTNNMPEFCVDDYRRIGTAKLEKEIAHNKWISVSTYPEWTYTRNVKGPSGMGRINFGHDMPDYLYLSPGERERLVLMNRVKSLSTGKILDKVVRKRLIPIRRGT